MRFTDPFCEPFAEYTFKVIFYNALYGSDAIVFGLSVYSSRMLVIIRPSVNIQPVVDSKT